MTQDRSIGDWFRSALPLVLLTHLSHAPQHGYGLMESLRAQGFEVKGATVYPHLNRLQEDGYIESEWHAPDSGPARKVMTITPEGRERLRVLRRQWGVFRDQIDAALGGVTQGDDER